MKLTHPNSMLVALAQQLIFIILVEVTFKTVKGTWVAAYLVLEFFIRMVCYAKLGVSVAHFFKTRSNAYDSLATVADVLFLYLVLSGSSNDQVEIILSEELRIARSSALDVSGRFFRLLRLQRLIIFAVKLCVQPLISLGRLRCKGPERKDLRPHVSRVVVPNYDAFRRYLSLLSQRSARVWPQSEYALQFQRCPTYDGSAIEAADIPNLLWSVGFESDAPTLRAIEQIVDIDAAGGMVLFDDLADALTLLRDEQIETKTFEAIKPRRLQAQRALRVVIARLTITFAVFLREFLASLTGLTVDVFILTRAVGGVDSDAIVGQFSSVIQESPFGTLHSFFDWFLSLALNIVRFVAENVTINLQFDEGVTCSGITSLLVLPILCLLTAIMVLIFDSSLFTFLEIASLEYNHHVSYQLHRFIPSTGYARSVLP